jgi:hypothetical protein
VALAERAGRAGRRAGVTLFEPDEAEGSSARRRLVAAGVALVVTGLLLGLVLALGAWALEYRRFTLHHGRVQRMLALDPRPTAAQVTEGLLAEPATRRLDVPADEAGLRALAARCAAGPPDVIVERSRRSREVRAFAVGEMVYFLYFDDAGLLADAVVEVRPRDGCQAGQTPGGQKGNR